MERFSGFPPEAVEFLEDLEMHNDRTWFHANKETFDRCCRVPMELLLAELTPVYGSGKVFRIQRDIRFSNDKTPYKTNISATFGSSYLSLSPSGFYCGTGGYMLDKGRLVKYREAVAKDGPGGELEKVTAALKKKGYDVGGHGEMKVVPRGYPRDHPRADLLRQKSVFVGRGFPIESWLHTRKTVDHIKKVISDAAPMTAWLDRYAPA